MGGSLLVRFGPGLEIRSLTATDVISPSVVVENLAAGTQIQEVYQLAVSFKPDLPRHAVRLLPKASAVIHFESMSAAQAALKALDGKLHNGSCLVARALKPTAASEDVTSIQCTWFQPAKSAFLQFTSPMAAAAVRSQELRGRRIKVVPQTPRAGFSRPYSVLLVGLDLKTTEEDLRQLYTFDAVKIRDPKFNVSREDTIAYIRSLFDGTRIKELKETSPRHEDLQRVAITVESAEDARRFYKEYEGKKHEFLGQTTLGISLMYSATFRFSIEICRAIKAEVEGLAEEEKRKEKTHRETKGKDEDAPARLLIYDKQIRVHGKGRPAVVRVKTAIQKLLRGEVVCGEDGRALWDPALKGPEGRRMILNIKNQTGVHINCDVRNQSLTFYGSPEARAAARIQLGEEYQKLLNRQHGIPLYGNAYRTFIRGGYAAVQEHLGADKVILNADRKLLIVRCSPAELEKVRFLMYNPGRKRPENEAAKEGECPVCFDTPTDPVNGQCGHVYCKSCAQGYILSALETQTYPITCFGGGDATCNAGFSIGMIKSLLTAADVDRLFSHCFMTYVQKRPLEHSFCPTPDCSTVYNISATGAVFTCSQCFVGICTTCKTECHEGQTCEEYQIATNPELDAQKLQEWKDKSGVRTCPNCKATVEKIDGCNHITCRCGTHWCWLCERSFADGPEVYNHLGSCTGAGAADPLLDRPEPPAFVHPFQFGDAAPVPPPVLPFHHQFFAAPVELPRADMRDVIVRGQVYPYQEYRDRLEEARVPAQRARNPHPWEYMERQAWRREQREQEQRRARDLEQAEERQRERRRAHAIAQAQPQRHNNDREGGFCCIM
jgi:hypothetical protein